jgi:hypothetical protein
VDAKLCYKGNDGLATGSGSSCYKGREALLQGAGMMTSFLYLFFSYAEKNQL